MSRLDDFQQRIHDVIPLTHAMGTELLHYDGRQLLVGAPLAPNSNHQGTGFGGAVYSVAVLAAWVLIELAVEDAAVDGTVVIQSGSMDYGQPVDSDFFAICQLPEPAEWERFLTMLKRRGRARVALKSGLYCGTPGLEPEGPAAAFFEGRFVVRAR
ncbi:thioesterase domain-containing protein [Marinobacter zhanjiangensis]|uniref:Thioesterase n=1 Tax=Marinobacter zhanjiangensis TaxID=578215 RepID=A0ABQ3ASU2_9GAMM|nr:thioesterase domain-containing protein [Marinobacter zhanjiangensis]GGY66246.1 thioesterase [Marinobacter zhanjiangensis]